MFQNAKITLYEKKSYQKIVIEFSNLYLQIHNEFLYRMSSTSLPNFEDLREGKEKR